MRIEIPRLESKLDTLHPGEGVVAYLGQHQEFSQETGRYPSGFVEKSVDGRLTLRGAADLLLFYGSPVDLVHQGLALLQGSAGVD